MTDEILFKYISDQASPEETLNVQKWAQGTEERQKELARLKNVWVLAGLENEINVYKRDQEIERIWNIIRQLTINEQKKVFRLRLIRYAAVLVLLIGFSGTTGYFISNLVSKSSTLFTEIIVPKGERSTVVLPDGTTVQLNSDSHLRFLSSFNSGKRRVILKGEGFFKVTPDKSRPFVVETPNIQVEVLGTIFNVSCYTNDSLVTTFLQSGKVKINIGNRDDIFLTPNEAYSYNTITHESVKMKITDKRFTDWTKGVLTINGETIGELAKKLERRFNIQIVFNDDEVKKHMYTGSIKDEDLNTVLKALTFASSINYERENNKITLFSKK